MFQDNSLCFRNTEHEKISSRLQGKRIVAMKVQFRLGGMIIKAGNRVLQLTGLAFAI